MRNKIFFSNFTLFIVVSGVLCLFYTLLFHPVTYQAQGDYPAYINLAKQIFNIPGAATTDLSHRSPLYSVVLGLFILIFGESGHLYPLMIFQYFLIFVTSILIYKIFKLLTSDRIIAFIAGIAGVLNLTTVFFGYMMLSETLTLFLFTWAVWKILHYYNMQKIYSLIIAGILTGLVVLARFNTLGLPVVIIIGLIIVHFVRNRESGINKLVKEITVFAISTLAILNLWAFYNYTEKGLYELLPKYHVGQRWAVPASINKENKTGDDYDEVLAIFLKTREELLLNASRRTMRKGSLLSNNLIRKVNDFFRPEVSGYFMYRDSEQELLDYYGLDNTPENIRILNEKLKPFYRIIAEQNRRELNRFRIYSFIYSFKHISPVLPYESTVSLNILPAFVLKLYKLAFIFVCVVAFAGSIIHCSYIISGREKLKSGIYWIILYSLIWYFPLVNWYASVLGDANRFRFPADAVILGIFICYCSFIYRRIKTRYRGIN
jgi:4-amino-4-deoxy-L-arabinose transferase-like glycosyltransferase